MGNWIRIKGQALGQHEGTVNLRVAPGSVIIFDDYQAVDSVVTLEEGQVVVAIG